MKDLSKRALTVFLIALGAIAYIALVSSEYVEQKESQERLKTIAAQQEALRAQREREFNALTPAQHLTAAKETWDRWLPSRPLPLGELNLAHRHLAAIPASAPESKEAAELIPLVEAVSQDEAEAIRQEAAEQAKQREEALRQQNQLLAQSTKEYEKLSFLCQQMESRDDLTKDCALQHLQGSDCSKVMERDFTEVQEVESGPIPPDFSPAEFRGRFTRQATAIYSFKKRPVAGPVSDWPQRDQIMFLKYAPTYTPGHDGQWVTLCQ